MKKFFSLMAAVLFAGSIFAAEELKATLDFTTNEAWQFPVSSGNGLTAENVYSDGTYSVTLAATTKYYFNSDGYLMIGKSGSTLTLPAFAWQTTKIVVTGRNGASTGTKQNIYVGGTAVSTETTGCTGANEYAIAADYQAAGNVYVLKIGSNHNAQVTKIEIYGEGGETPVEPTPDYYLVGNFNNWQADAAYKLVANPGNSAEMMIAGVELEANDSLKVIGILGETTTWYPDNAANYVVAADGEYDIYFRADGQGGDDWYYHCIYLAEVAPVVLPTYTCAQVQANEATEAGVLNEVTVMWVNGANAFVKDATGMTQVYLKNNGLAVGDVVSGIEGTSTVYKSTPEFVPTNTPADWTVAHGETPAYEEKTVVPTSADVNGVYKFMNVTFAEAPAYSTSTQVNATATIGEETVVIRDNYKIGASLAANTAYDIVAVVVLYNNNAQLYFITAEEHTATAIDNTNVDAKAVKFFENGQLIILKNGVYYNAQGAVVR